MKLSPTGSAVLYRTPFIGGVLAVDPNDRLVVHTAAYLPQVVRTPKGVVTSACGETTLTLAYVSGSTFNVETIEPAAGPEAACVLNAASLAAPNRLAPGEIFTIVGVGIGPKTPAAVPRVLLNGAPVPVLYADDGQINAIAPFVLPSDSLSVEVEYQGRRSPAVAIQAARTQTGVFTFDGSGAGQGIVFNQDGTLNGASNPVATSIEPRPVSPMQISLGGPGGNPAGILYAGPSRGSLTSVTQFNLRLPAALDSTSSFPLTAWPLVLLPGAPITQLATVALRN